MINWHVGVAISKMDENERRSSLLFYLGQAQSKISSLEDYIREREKQYRSVVNRFERSDSRNMAVHAAAASSVVVGGGGGARLRRVGLSHNLLQMRTISTSMEDEEQDECKSL